MERGYKRVREMEHYSNKHNQKVTTRFTQKIHLVRQTAGQRDVSVLEGYEFDSTISNSCIVCVEDHDITYSKTRPVWPSVLIPVQLLPDSSGISGLVLSNDVDLDVSEMMHVSFGSSFPVFDPSGGMLHRRVIDFILFFSRV